MASVPMAGRVRVLALLKDEAYARALRASIQPYYDVDTFTFASNELKGFFDTLNRQRPDVVLMELNLDIGVTEWLSLVRELKAEHPDLPLLLIYSDDVNPAILKQATFSGINGIFSRSEDVASLVEDIRQVYRMRQSQTRGQPEGNQRSGGQVIAVAGLKGGVGRTLIAANLAAYLGTRVADTVLLDLNLETGSQAALFGLDEQAQLRHSIVQLVGVFDEGTMQNERMQVAARRVLVDKPTIERVLYTHPSGLKLLGAAPRPELTDNLTDARVQGLLSRLRDYYSLIILDLPAHFDAFSAAAMIIADAVLLVTTPQILSMRNNFIFLRTLSQLRHKPPTLYAIINREHQGTILSRDDIARSLDASCKTLVREQQAALNIDRVFGISQDEAMVERMIAENKLVLNYADHPISQQIFAIGDDIIALAPDLRFTGAPSLVKGKGKRSQPAPTMPQAQPARR